ncbi:MAG: hypothetical protein Q7R45_08390 [Sulfuricaulis sp.]|nr:hypothetical protein [Sulfuricaulis sp.]
MISPSAAIVGKTAVVGVATVAAVEIAAYQITPDIFNSVAVGVGSLIVAVVAVVGLLLHARSDRQALKQHLEIAKQQAAWLRENAAEMAKNSAETHEIKISMDGRMDALLEATAKINEELGIKKGLAQSRLDATAATARDNEIISRVSSDVVDRIGAAADIAAQTIPGTRP